MQARVKWVEGLTFIGESASGHQILMDGNSGDKAPSPMEMVLMAAGGCSAIDVVSILQKGRHNVTNCEVKLTSERREEAPRLFTHINMHFIVTGKELKGAELDPKWETADADRGNNVYEGAITPMTLRLPKFPEGSKMRKALACLLEEFFGHTTPESLSKNGLNWIAVPKDVAKLPKWVLDLIDKDSVLAANTSVVHPILESVGIRVIERPEPAVYSNCIRF